MATADALIDNRLFHRFPCSLRVAYRVGGVRHRGALINISVGGGMVEATTLPTLGSRMQLAVKRKSGEPAIWLDLHVVWVNPTPDSEHPVRGFGALWRSAASRDSEEHLRKFLSTVLGITKPTIRQVALRKREDSVHIHRFPNLWRELGEDELPWMDGLRIAERRSESILIAGVPSSSDSMDIPLGPGSDSQPDGDIRMTGVFTTDESLTAELDSPPDGSTAPGKGGRWGFLVRKLSGLRVRTPKPSQTPATPEPVGLDAPRATVASRVAGTSVLSDEERVIRYRIGKKAQTGRLLRVGLNWIVFQPDGDVPDAWSRLVLTLSLGADRKAGQVDVHATVTRIKKESDPPVVHLKINRVDEKGHVGAYTELVTRCGGEDGG